MFPLYRWRLIVAHIALAIACVVMLITARSIAGAGTTGDFPLFLTAGRDLLAGRPLHSPQGGYVYGPFPALLFAMLTPFSPAAGAWAMGIFNAGALWLSLVVGPAPRSRTWKRRRTASASPKSRPSPSSCRWTRHGP
jgi:hypothetical protein